MKEIIKKFCTLILAAAMMVTLTPLHGVWGTAYADDEEEDFPFFGLEQIGEGPCRLFDDGIIRFRIPDEAMNCDDTVTRIEPFVGIPQDGPWESLGDECYEYDAETHIITVFGDVIGNKYPAPDYGAPEWIGVSFEAFDDQGKTRWIAGTRDLEFWYSYVNDYMPGDEIKLPGWDGSIDGTLMAYIENAEHPDGEDIPVNVDDIQVIGGEELLEEWHPDSDEENHWWYYRCGRKTGRVTFRIFYTDFDGQNKTHDMHLDIANDVYESNLWSDGDVYQVLPGEEIYLNAWGLHKYMVGDREEATEKGLDFVWSLERGEEFAQVIRDEKDHSKARLVFKDLGPDEENFWAGCRVRMAMIDTADKDDPNGEKTVETRWFNCGSDFYDIYPLGLDGNLGLGESTGEQTLELRHYRYNSAGKDGYNSENYKLAEAGETWFDFDKNAVRVTVNGNKTVEPGERQTDVRTFSIKKLREWGTEVRVNVDFKNDNGDDDHRDHNYWFNDLNYDIWFNSEGDRVYDDSDWTIYLEKRDDLNYDNLDIEYSVRGFVYDEYSDQEEEVDVPADCYRVASDKMSITLIGEKLAKQNIDSVDIRAELFYEGESLGRWEERRFWVEESCPSRGEDHLWLSLPTFTDCTSKGILRQICWNCGERRVTTAPPKGHTAAAVKAVASTASKEGNIAYWKCAECGKLFGDAKCTKAITKDSTITPKGITINKVTAQKKGFTVAWKKPASPYINHTTGYEIMYALNSKFTSGKKTASVAGAATVSKKISKLKAKKKYYIKIRTYRTIDGKKYYSPWSKVKTIKTK